MSCYTPDACDDCAVYDLCKVTVKGGECAPGTETSIICEGFKISAKLDVEVKSNCACYEGYGYQVSNLQYDWEITNPCDREWFDKRFTAQICDKYSMEITGYVQLECGKWTPRETLKACIIEETGREYGKGVQRTLRGKALHRIIQSGKWDSDGNVYHASKAYEQKTAFFQEGGQFDQTVDGIYNGFRKTFLAGSNSSAGQAYYGIGQAGDLLNQAIDGLNGGLIRDFDLNPSGIINTNNLSI